jgi:hypothetical protein
MIKKQISIPLAICALALSQLMCIGGDEAVEFNSTITITVFADTDRNGVQDAGEVGIPGVRVEWWETQGAVDINGGRLDTLENGQASIQSGHKVGGDNRPECPLVGISVTPPQGMVLTGGSNPVEIRDWNCEAGASAEQNRSLSFGFAEGMSAGIPTPTQPPVPTPEPPTPTAVPTYAVLSATVNAENLSCRYGPGAMYLYEYGLREGNEVQVLGRADTADGTWVNVQFSNINCWVNEKYLDMNGESASLEPLYPQKSPLILFSHPNFPPVTDVFAKRNGDQVEIDWNGYELALGDRESAESPQYLVETWTCIGGQIVFTAYGAFEEYSVVTDEPGCSEPSHGQVYIAHKDGYIGPVPIPWPGE